jgi:transposase
MKLCDLASDGDDRLRVRSPVFRLEPAILTCRLFSDDVAWMNTTQKSGGTVEIAYVDQGYTGVAAAEQARQSSIELEIVKHTEAKRGFVLLPRRWVVERTFGCLGRFRRLTRDYERLAETLKNWHWLAFLGLLMSQIGIQSA